MTDLLTIVAQALTTVTEHIEDHPAEDPCPHVYVQRMYYERPVTITYRISAQHQTQVTYVHDLAVLATTRLPVD